jgi:squalene cyclase
MRVETGQLRVWSDAITYDKTPFLVIGRVIYPDAAGPFTEQADWHVLWLGKIGTWSTHRIESFSEVTDESR